MNDFKALDPDFLNRVHSNFAAQKLMQTLRAELTKVEPGEITIEIPFGDEFTQQNGFIHAGIVTSIADSACGYAAFTLMPAAAEVLSVEFKVNLLSPAIGEKFIARAQVIKPGRTLTVCRADVFAINKGEEKIVATMLATIFTRKNNE